MPRYTLGKDLGPLADVHCIIVFLYGQNCPLHLPFSINHWRVDPTSHLLPPFPSPPEQLLPHPYRPWPCLARTPLLAGSAPVRRCWTSWQAWAKLRWGPWMPRHPVQNRNYVMRSKFSPFVHPPGPKAGTPTGPKACFLDDFGILSMNTLLFC